MLSLLGEREDERKIFTVANQNFTVANSHKIET